MLLKTGAAGVGCVLNHFTLTRIPVIGKSIFSSQSASRLLHSQLNFPLLTKNCKQFNVSGTKRVTSSKPVVSVLPLMRIQACSSKQNTDFKHLSDSTWSCKLALENGYLSWCRNAYIAGVFSVGMLFNSQSEQMDLACFAIFLIPLLNMTWGTLSYIYSLTVMRQRLGMSQLSLAASVGWAILKMMIFVSAVLIFISEADPANTLSRRKQQK